jgi:hypothetical protein
MWENDFVAGVDGCKTGWVWFKLYGSGRTETELVNLVDVLQRRPEGLKLEILGVTGYKRSIQPNGHRSNQAIREFKPVFPFCPERLHRW